MSDRSTRRSVLRRLGVGASALAVGTATLSGPAAAQRRFCPKTVGFWKNHTDEWTKEDGSFIERMWLAGDPYPSLPQFADDDEVTILDVLTAPPKGDKSIIMAKQRIAAQLNYRISVKCEESHRAFAHATAWLQSLDGPFVDGQTIGTGKRWWAQSVQETTYDIVGTEVTVEAGVYGEEVKDWIEQYNQGKLCDCSIE
ncbi:hypothetical protein VB773_00230 [Haloarculaceae archaeon H-GB2-1]|nr:hypothetical protein [Haloarculaceae archaeon H-GB1-1]MEA5388136.1 hypothetical protein [Haloarculaceae archaeon H-GB11]MEA5406158.1 hypothetical protein [Haloarculaceae archaeon H-GB2-1]